MGLDIYSGTLTRYYSHNWKPLFSSERRKTDIPSTASPRMGNLPAIRMSCPRLRSRQHWKERFLNDAATK